MPSITGQLEDFDGVKLTHGQVVLEPYGEDAQIDGEDVRLGFKVLEAKDLPDPLVLSAGSWTITILTNRAQGYGAISRNKFATRKLDIELTTDMTWVEVFEGGAPTPPAITGTAQALLDAMTEISGLDDVEDAVTLLDADSGSTFRAQQQARHDARYARRVGGNVNAAAYGFGYGETAATNQAAVQAALDAVKDFGGTVVIPAPEAPFSPAAYAPMDTVTVWQRINLVGASKLGARLQAKAGIQSAIIKVGDTTGADPNWHWGEIRDIYLDGNKANQSAQTARTLTAATASAYVATLTTSGAHGYSIGDVVEVTGVTPDAYNGRWRVESVPTTTTLTIQVLTNGPAAGTVFGTSRRMLNLINVGKGGETSVIRSVYGANAFNSGIHQGTTGTPMRYANVSMFLSNDYGFDLWCDRPIQMDTPSGDYSGLGLIRLAGKSSASGTGTDSVVLINNIKAEHHTVPAVILEDFDGAVTLAGGSIDMEVGNTAAPIRRTSASANSSVTALGLRVNKRATGAIFEDLHPAAQSVTTSVSTAASYTFNISFLPMQVTRLAQRRNDLTDGATVTPNLQNGGICKLSAGGSRTIATPTNPPAGTPNAQEILFDIKNNTAGSITTTWSAAYLLAGAWVDPAPGKRRTIRFYWDGSWVETSRGAADI